MCATGMRSHRGNREGFGVIAFLSDEQLLRPERHIFLSPHYDDIPLSCGGVATRVSQSGTAPEIALIFGDHPDSDLPLTAFARQLHEQWGHTAEQVINSRRAEESTASALIGAVDVYLPFHDAIYRGSRYTSDAELFGETSAEESDLPERIVSELGISDAELGAVRLYAPLAIGNHIDHQHAFTAGLLLASGGCDVWFYEDLPYALIPGRAEERMRRIESPLASAGLVDVRQVWQTKIDAIMAYPSQLAVIFSEYVGSGSTREAIDAAMGAYSEEGGHGIKAERFWRVTE
ncbi:PIG-L family deacetylase [soil metagenome]